MFAMMVVRAFQFLFAATVLALSVILIKDFGSGKAPALEGYAAFCGGAGLIINLVGIAALFFEPLQGVIMLCLDGVAAFFTLAGGIALAAVLKIGSCDNVFYLGRNGKPFLVGSSRWQYMDAEEIVDSMKYRCRMTQADIAILWFLFATFAAASALHFVSGRSKSHSFA